MTIKVGDKLPAGTLSEYVEVEGNGCSVGPNPFTIEALTAGKKVVLFGIPGAFTPTCSAQHVPGYLAQLDALKAKGVAEVICMSMSPRWRKAASASMRPRRSSKASACAGTRCPRPAATPPCCGRRRRRSARAAACGCSTATWGAP